jgi:multidrug efflux pump subunit AcrA (membrane-fusion protein)
MRDVQRTWVVLLAVAIALSSCGRRGVEVTEPAASTEIGVTAMPTLPAPALGQTVAAEGRLISPYPNLVHSFGGGVSGRLLSIDVRPGDVVEQGDLLAALDDTELVQAVEDAQLTLERAQTDLELAQQEWQRDLADAEQALADAERSLSTARLQYSATGVEEARTSLDRAVQAEANAEEEYLKALDRHWEPQGTVDAYYDTWQRAIRDRELAELRLADAEDSLGASYLDLQSREEEVARAGRALEALERGLAPAHERAVEDAERQLVQAEEALSHALLRAPWDAMVYSIEVAPAAQVAGGTPVVTLINVADGLRFVADNLSEQHVADIRPGQRTQVTLRAFAETPMAGAVEAIVPQMEQTGSAEGRFTVYVLLDATELPLLPGYTGRVQIMMDAER